MSDFANDDDFLGENPTDAKLRKVRLKNMAYSLFDKYKYVLVCNMDHVGSKQMQQIRHMLRGRAEIMMGKKSILRKVIRDSAERNPKMLELVPELVGNVGLVLINEGEDIAQIRNEVIENQVPAAAKTGVIAPQDVYVGPGSTGLDPGQTSFFQALNIPTKIVRGSIEIVNQVHLIRKGSKVSASAVALLSKLNNKPFFYGVTALSVYEDGTVYDVKILDLTDADLSLKFMNGVRYLAAVSMACGMPNEASLPHYVANGFQRLLALALVTEIDFEEAKPYKEILANPEAFKAAAAPAAAAAGPAAAEQAAPESESESEAEEFSLFD